jgi:molecular chaperone GrpE
MDDRVRRAEDLLEERRRTREDGEDTVSEGAADRTDDPAADADMGTAVATKVDELTRDLQRVAADFANYRRRNEAERADFARFAKAELITKLLEVLDNFDRALETVPADLRTQPWVEGMWLVERKLRDILASEGLETVDSVGKPFDPYIHEALAHVDADAPEGTVVDEVRKAYKLHDRVIRPALVTVAKRKENDHA